MTYWELATLVQGSNLGPKVGMFSKHKLDSLASTLNQVNRGINTLISLILVNWHSLGVEN